VTLEAYRNDAREKYGVMADEFLKLYPALRRGSHPGHQNRPDREHARLLVPLGHGVEEGRRNDVYTFS